MKLGIVQETRAEERRVAASPNVVAKWVKVKNPKYSRAEGRLEAFQKLVSRAALLPWLLHAVDGVR